MIAVGIDPNRLRQWFRSCEVVSHITNPADIDKEESGDPVSLCRGLAQP